jgi:probable HAF family extracellular repeat protein
MLDLGTLGGDWSYATAVSDANHVVGGSYMPGTHPSMGPYDNHAFLWTETTGMIDLGTLPGDRYSTANAVNDRGQVVGYSVTADAAGNPGRWHAFLWSQEEGMIDLGTLGGSSSAAIGIDRNGRVVGYSTLSGDSVVRAFSWSREGGMVELPSLGGNHAEPTAISKNGFFVAGWGDLPGATDEHALLWWDPNDVDGDGYQLANDCNDRDAAIHLGAAEVVLDGNDQDCNGYDLTIQVSKATFSVADGSLRVEAGTALGASGLLRVEGVGPMTWKNGKWSYNASPVPNPGQVTVCGVEGCVSVAVTTE